MRQRLAIIITVAVVLVLLAVLNSASYVRIEKTSDLEARPNRSTYNAGATGTRALYDFLTETGRKPLRWTESPAMLLNRQPMQTATFVIVGDTLVQLENEDVENLLLWVNSGGRLVLIDRSPDTRLLPPSGHWNFSIQLTQFPTSEILADNPEQMTQGVQPLRAGQPTLLTRRVETALPSRFAGLISFYAKENENNTAPQEGGGPSVIYDEETGEPYEQEPPPPGPPLRRAPTPASPPSTVAVKEIASPAPVAHLYNERGALLVDYKHGAGQIIVLSDPFIAANNGISRADNLQLALNVVGGREGLILFDEYHQGHAVSNNRLIAYFAGTPVLAMLGQLGLIVLVVIWTRGRRFARPLPLPQVDRRSKLEYVASMAELQERARAFDLAIENIYARTRRVLARYAGTDNMAPRSEIAARVAARSKLNRPQLEKLMHDCEEAINGAPLTAKRSLALVAGLREVERVLGLRMRSREIRQAKEQGVGDGV